MRKDETLTYLRPDGKTQVTVEYDENNIPVRIDTIVISAQHHPEITLEQIQRDIKEFVINPVVPTELIDEDTKYFINPTGRFVIGGPQGDAGLTGRKIIVDTYGGYARHGGGAFSGKDATKVDRSASYAARYVAKNIVAAGLADRCEVQLAYAIGVAQPVSISIDTFGTGNSRGKQTCGAVRVDYLTFVQQVSSKCLICVAQFINKQLHTVISAVQTLIYHGNKRIKLNALKELAGK